jgi:hypothetical protein
MINGRAVHPDLLEARPLSRCNLAECQSYCCNGGVWIHTSQVDDILAHQDLIIPHLPPDRRDPTQWFDGVIEPDIDYPEAGDCMSTMVVPDPTHPAGQTCIFLTPDQRLCALQKAGIEAGEHPWRYKPFYCALHPLGLGLNVLELEEESEIYKEGGNCSRPSGELIPLYQLFDVETKLVLGEDGYAELDRLAQARGIGVS